jgi:hypothetical protein
VESDCSGVRLPRLREGAPQIQQIIVGRVPMTRNR